MLGRPPVDITITGGEWNEWSSSDSSRGATDSYSSSERGTSYRGGVVSGRIGAMGFGDEAYGGYTASTYPSVERIR